MPSNDKAKLAALGLLALSGCVGGGDHADAPRVQAPSMEAMPDRSTPPARYTDSEDGYARPAQEGYADRGTNYPPPQDRPQPAYPERSYLERQSRQEAPPPDMPQGSGPRGTSGDVRYDEVGYAGVGAGSPGISGAVRGLPRGSYVEVTALDTGRTILVLVADQMAPGNRTIDLSPGAAQLLGVGEGAPVRVRRVDPPPPDQNALANGQAASPRLDAPQTLLTALRRKLGAPVASRPILPQPSNDVGASYAPPPRRPRPAASAPVPAPVASGGYFVQVAALSSRDRAVALSSSLGGGSVVQAGNVWRVRTGPYRDAASAQRARDALAARGYGGAQVVRDQ